MLKWFLIGFFSAFVLLAVVGYICYRVYLHKTKKAIEKAVKSFNIGKILGCTCFLVILSLVLFSPSLFGFSDSALLHAAAGPTVDFHVYWYLDGAVVTDYYLYDLSSAYDHTFTGAISGTTLTYSNSYNSTVISYDFGVPLSSFTPSSFLPYYDGHVVIYAYSSSASYQIDWYLDGTLQGSTDLGETSVESSATVQRLDNNTSVALTSGNTSYTYDYGDVYLAETVTVKVEDGNASVYAFTAADQYIYWYLDNNLVSTSLTHNINWVGSAPVLQSDAHNVRLVLASGNYFTYDYGSSSYLTSVTSTYTSSTGNCSVYAVSGSQGVTYGDDQWPWVNSDDWLLTYCPSDYGQIASGDTHYEDAYIEFQKTLPLTTYKTTGLYVLGSYNTSSVQTNKTSKPGLWFPAGSYVTVTPRCRVTCSYTLNGVTQKVYFTPKMSVNSTIFSYEGLATSPTFTVLSTEDGSGSTYTFGTVPGHIPEAAWSLLASHSGSGIGLVVDLADISFCPPSVAANVKYSYEVWVDLTVRIGIDDKAAYLVGGWPSDQIGSTAFNYTYLAGDFEYNDANDAYEIINGYKNSSAWSDVTSMISKMMSVSFVKDLILLVLAFATIAYLAIRRQ